MIFFAMVSFGKYAQKTDSSSDVLAVSVAGRAMPLCG